jgi:D-aspartate ligase
MSIPAPLPALVIGTDVSALNVVRSLGRRGIPVYVMGSNPRDYGSSSRYARFVFCENLYDEKTILSCLQDVGRNFATRMILYCTSDLHVTYVSQNRKLLHAFFEFVFPEHEVIGTLIDKKNFNDFAVRHGFPVPQTFFSDRPDDLEKLAPTIPYPCVAKPLFRTRYWSEHVSPLMKVIKAASPGELLERLAQIKAFDKSLVLQEWIPAGDEEVYFCLAYVSKQGTPLAAVAGRKLRQFPPLTGVTSMAESITHQELSELALAVLRTAGCTGLCSVEFKRDATSNAFKITEPTVGRVDLQEGLATAAGADLPYLAYLDAIDERLPPQTEYRPGVKWINEPFELNSFAASRTGEGRNAGSFFQHYRGYRSYALLAPDDLLPFVRFLLSVTKRASRRLSRPLVGFLSSPDPDRC